MAEGIIRPESEQVEQSDADGSEQSQQSEAEEEQATATVIEAAPAVAADGVIIWTPRFIVLFFLTLVIALSLEGLFAEATLIHLVDMSWILLAHCVVLFGCWMAVVVKARSPWLRLGASFGCIWVVFTALAVMWGHFHVTASFAFAYINVAASCALLGSYICLSTGNASLARWDNWFFRVALVGGACAIAIAFVRTPADARSFGSLENSIATTFLFICVCVWWLRPACWQGQPGPTLLYGLAPAITLFLMMPGVASGETSFFLVQVGLLCLILGTMRVLQGEIVGAGHYEVAS